MLFYGDSYVTKILSAPREDPCIRGTKYVWGCRVESAGGLSRGPYRTLLTALRGLTFSGLAWLQPGEWAREVGVGIQSTVGRCVKGR